MTEQKIVTSEYNMEEYGINLPDKNYRICTEKEMGAFFPKRKRNTDKTDYGSANIIAGSAKYPGAAALSCCAALKSGCGYVKLTTDESVKLALVAKYPQVIYLDEIDFCSGAIAVGMGCGVSIELYSKLSAILKRYTGTLIIDADGINTLAKYGKDILTDKKCTVIITPHIREFARLSGLSVEQIQNDAIIHARSFARKYNLTVLLKGAASVITDGDKTVINLRGTTALAKGGSGDMLSGYIAGTAARGVAPFEAAVCSAYVMGMSAEICSEQKTDYCVTAMDILNNLHFAVKRLTH